MMSLHRKIIVYLLGIFLFVTCYAKDRRDIDFTLTLKNDVAVYVSPNISSSSLVTMPIGHWVKIISNSNKEVKIDNQNGIWIYIDARLYKRDSEDTIKGWVPSFYIAKKQEFSKTKKFGSYHIDGMVGDAIYDIFFNKDGTFKDNVYDDKGKLKKYVTGYIYQKNNVVVTIGEETFEIFYLDENGDLFSIHPDYTGNPIKAKVLGARAYPMKVTTTATTPNKADDTYTLTGDNVNVRAEADAKAKVLTTLKKGQKVKLIKRSDIALTVGDKKGYWAQIDTGKVKGWVFDYYLKAEGKYK